jgi:hypothetical protein
MSAPESVEPEIADSSPQAPRLRAERASKIAETKRVLLIKGFFMDTCGMGGLPWARPGLQHAL